MESDAPFHMTDNGIAAQQGKLNNRAAEMMDSAREANGLPPVPPELRSKRVGRGAMVSPPSIANRKGPCS